VTPVYNGEKYLQETIDSVLAQTWADFEYVIVDNRSTDTTAEIAQKAAAMDDRVRVVSELEQGISPARNHGVRVTTAPLIAFVDADDVWEPTFLQRAAAALEAAPCEVVGVFVGIKVIDHASEHTGDAPLPSGRYNAARFLAESNPALCGSALLVRRAALVAAGPFDQDYSPVEDLHQWLLVMDTVPGGHFLAISEHLCRYRKHPGAITARSDAQLLTGLVRLRDEWADRLDRQSRARASAQPAYLAAKLADQSARRLIVDVARGGPMVFVSPGVARVALRRYLGRAVLRR
jgi:glycosyltransferase involved in cell wall biosynthesis